MRVLAVVHQRDAGPGVFGEAVAGPATSWWSGCPRRAAPELDGSTPRWSSAARCTWTRRTPSRGCAARRSCCASSSAAACRSRGCASAPSCWPRRRAARRGAARAGDRLGPDRAHAGGRDDPLFGALPSASRPSSGTATRPRRPRARWPWPSPVCLQAYRLAGAGVGDPVPCRGHGARGERLARRLGHDEDAVRIGLDAEGLRRQTAPRARGLERARTGAWRAASSRRPPRPGHSGVT